MTDWVFVIGIILIIAGIALLVLEIIHPLTFFVIPGMVVLVAGFLFIFFPDLVTQTVWGAAILVIVAFAAALATIPIYRWIAPTHKPMVTTPTSITGESGLVVSPIVPDSLSGKVRVRSEVWSARSKVPIPAGARVRVVGGEGVAVWVEVEPTAAASGPVG